MQVGLEGVVGERQLLAGGVDAPAVQFGCLAQRPVLEHRFELADVDHHIVAVPERVDAVEDVSGRHLHPANVGIGAAEGHHPDAGAVLRLPAERQIGTLGRHRQVEHHRELPEDHVTIGDGEVVHHRRLAHLDRRRVNQPALGVGHVVGEERLEEPVAEEVQLAGLGIHLGVRGHVGVQLAVEVVDADRGQVLRRQLVGKADLARREQLVVVGERRDVAVADVPTGYPGVSEPVTAFVQGGPHPTVGVRLGLAALKANPVQHAVANEPVAGVGVDRVGSVADVQPGQLVGDRAGDLERGRPNLLGDRRKVALQPPGLVALHLGERTRGARSGRRRGRQPRRCLHVTAAGGQHAGKGSNAQRAAPRSSEKLPSIHGSLLHGETIVGGSADRVERYSML